MSDRPARILVTGLAASTRCGVGVAPLFARLERDMTSHGAACEGDKQYRFPPITTDISEYVRITRTENELTLPNRQDRPLHTDRRPRPLRQGPSNCRVQPTDLYHTYRFLTLCDGSRATAG